MKSHRTRGSRDFSRRSPRNVVVAEGSPGLGFAGGLVGGALIGSAVSGGYGSGSPYPQYNPYLYQAPVLPITQTPVSTTGTPIMSEYRNVDIPYSENVSNFYSGPLNLDMSTSPQSLSALRPRLVSPRQRSRIPVTKETKTKVTIPISPRKSPRISSGLPAKPSKGGVTIPIRSRVRTESSSPRSPRLSPRLSPRSPRLSPRSPRLSPRYEPTESWFQL